MAPACSNLQSDALASQYVGVRAIGSDWSMPAMQCGLPSVTVNCSIDQSTPNKSGIHNALRKGMDTAAPHADKNLRDQGAKPQKKTYTTTYTAEQISSSTAVPANISKPGSDTANLPTPNKNPPSAQSSPPSSPKTPPTTVPVPASHSSNPLLQPDANQPPTPSSLPFSLDQNPASPSTPLKPTAAAAPPASATTPQGPTSCHNPAATNAASAEGMAPTATAPASSVLPPAHTSPISTPSAHTAAGHTPTHNSNVPEPNANGATANDTTTAKAAGARAAEPVEEAVGSCHTSNPSGSTQDGAAEPISSRSAGAAVVEAAGKEAGAEDAAVPAAAAASEPAAAAATAKTEPVQICFDFTKGMCRRGAQCRFSHDLATIVEYNSKEKGICYEFLQGDCRRGLMCRFSHDLSSVAQESEQVLNLMPTRDRAPSVTTYLSAHCFRTTPTAPPTHYPLMDQLSHIANPQHNPGTPLPRYPTYTHHQAAQLYPDYPSSPLPVATPPQSTPQPHILSPYLSSSAQSKASSPYHMAHRTAIPSPQDMPYSTPNSAPISTYSNPHPIAPPKGSPYQTPPTTRTFSRLPHSANSPQIPPMTLSPAFNDTARTPSSTLSPQINTPNLQSHLQPAPRSTPSYPQSHQYHTHLQSNSQSSFTSDPQTYPPNLVQDNTPSPWDPPSSMPSQMSPYSLTPAPPHLQLAQMNAAAALMHASQSPSTQHLPATASSYPQAPTPNPESSSPYPTHYSQLSQMSQMSQMSTPLSAPQLNSSSPLDNYPVNLQADWMSPSFSLPGMEGAMGGSALTAGGRDSPALQQARSLWLRNAAMP